MACNTLPQPEDDSDRHILASIERDGWAVLGIQEEDDCPAYAFTVGMHYTFGGAELVMFGHQAETATGILNHAGGLMREGREFAIGEPVEGLLEGFRAVLAPVHPRLFREYFGYARWLYSGSNFPMLQLVWPDRAGRFPWDSGYPEQLFWRQRLLGSCARWPHGFPFPTVPNGACFTTKKVTGGAPVLLVTHDAEGSWQFLTGERVKKADAQVVSLEAMLSRTRRWRSWGTCRRATGRRANRPTRRGCVPSRDRGFPVARARRSSNPSFCARNRRSAP